MKTAKQRDTCSPQYTVHVSRSNHACARILQSSTEHIALCRALEGDAYRRRIVGNLPGNGVIRNSSPQKLSRGSRFFILTTNPLDGGGRCPAYLAKGMAWQYDTPFGMCCLDTRKVAIRLEAAVRNHNAVIWSSHCCSRIRKCFCVVGCLSLDRGTRWLRVSP